MSPNRVTFEGRCRFKFRNCVSACTFTHRQAEANIQTTDFCQKWQNIMTKLINKGVQ